MDRFLLWKSQSDADAMLRHIGFEERKNDNGAWKYINEDTGEWLDLARPKYFYHKAVQQGVLMARSELSRVADVLRNNKDVNKLKAELAEVLKQEASYLDNITASIGVTDHEEELPKY